MTNFTIVSCYYKIKSKRPHDEYDIYIKNLLTNMKDNMVIYTSEDLVEYLKSYIKDGQNIKIVIKPFESLEVFYKYKDILKEQEKIDEHAWTGRSYYCYVLWNSKLQFIKETIEYNPFNSDKFMWLDIGAIRTNDIVDLLNKLVLL